VESGFYDNVVLMICIFWGIASILYYTVRKFAHERKLKQSEIAAELDILSEKLSEKQKAEEEHL
jgi:heme/copper-type cytochrome/quinol oxidase subunit 2